LFLREAVDFCNDQVWGNLSCGLFIPDKSLNAFSIEVEKAISNLRYGGIGLNIWAAVIYALPSGAWGGYYTNTLRDVQSGVGFVHNGALVDNIEKTVLRSPLVLPFNAPLPYFPRHKNIVGFFEAASQYEINPTYMNFGWTMLSALKG